MESPVAKKMEPPPIRPERYSRARWKHFMRYYGIILVVLLNWWLAMSTIQLHQVGKALEPMRELASFMVVLFFDVTILLPALLEVDAVEILSNGVSFSTVIGKRKYAWTDIRSFANPIYLNYVIVRTGCWIYLLNKRDISQISELVQKIQNNLGKLAK